MSASDVSTPKCCDETWHYSLSCLDNSNFMPAKILAIFTAPAVMTGCASTTIEITGTRPTQPLCHAGQPAVSTMIYWGTQWRPDQKKSLLREAAAQIGIEDFVRRAGCMAVLSIQRLPAAISAPTNEELRRLVTNLPPAPEQVLLIVVHELGPRLVIGIPVIVAGGTEVQIEVRLMNPKTAEPLANTQALWQNGGPFVIKGVKTLNQDMSDALNAVLMRGMASP